MARADPYAAATLQYAEKLQNQLQGEQHMPTWVTNLSSYTPATAYNAATLTGRG